MKQVHPKEKDVQKQILEWLELKKYVCHRNNTGTAFSEYKGKRYMVKYGAVGSADIICILPPNGRYCGLEVKGWGKHLSEHQQSFKANIERVGGIYEEVHSIEEVENLLKNF